MQRLLPSPATVTESVLHSFTFSDGEEPYAGLINVNGTLYGTTYGHGGISKGTVCTISKSGAETVLYSFRGKADGAKPQAGLTNVRGTLYGTTFEGGGSRGGVGTVYSLSGF